MARITIEDCMDNVESRFELVAIAARRAKDIASGNDALIARDNDKDSVVSLREIAGNHVSVEVLREGVVSSLQRPGEQDELELIESMSETPNSAPTPEETAALLEAEMAESIEMLDEDNENGMSVTNAEPHGMFSEENINVED